MVKMFPLLLLKQKVLILTSNRKGVERIGVGKGACIIFSIIVIAVIFVGPWKVNPRFFGIDRSEAGQRQVTVFIDDGLSESDGVEVITLNSGGSPGEHFDILWRRYSANVGEPEDVFVIDVVGENKIANPEDIARAINLAIEKNAKIINISLSTINADVYLEQAVKRAVDEGIIVVSSTASGLEKIPSYPASLPGVVGVYPKASNNKNYWFSNTYGADLGVVVEPEGGSSLAAVLVTAKINQCVDNEFRTERQVIQGLLACRAGVAVSQ